MLEAGENAFDTSGLPVEGSVVQDGDLPASSGRDAGLDAAFDEISAEPAAVVV